jgi:hypothetical protein
MVFTGNDGYFLRSGQRGWWAGRREEFLTRAREQGKKPLIPEDFGKSCDWLTFSDVMYNFIHSCIKTY